MQHANSATLTGDGGEIRWAYYPVATLGPWTLTMGDSRRVLTGAVVSVQMTRVNQTPLTFVYGRRTWPVESLSIADGRVTARLGPQEAHGSMSARSS